MFITITGRPCSGKSTVSNLLAEQHNFKKISVGGIFKEEAHKRRMNAEEFSSFCLKDPTFDFFIDNKTTEIALEHEKEDIIFDSRMAWHFVPFSFKVFIDLDEDEMARRLINSDRKGKEKYTDIKEAKKSLLNRERVEIERYKKNYNQELSDMRNFDFVVDGANKTPQEIADEIWAKYLFFIECLKPLPSAKLD